MGSGSSANPNNCPQRLEKRRTLPDATHPAFKAAVLIQRWYRRYMARLEMRRRCTWRIFQSIEYSCEQDQIKLHNFFSYLMDHFTPRSSGERDFISRMFTEEENYRESELEKFCDYDSVEVPDSYTGPHLSFPLLPDHAAALLEAFKQKQQLHAHYVLKLLHETRKHLKQLPNINHVSTCYSEEVTVCGDLHGQLDDLFLIFYKNGLPSPEKSYVFNGDFVDRGKNSIEILIILFAFLLVYPKEVHLNRGNHEDHMVNLRYGFTKEVMQKYKGHGKKILKMIQNVFCWLPLATLIDHKVLILHGGVSDTTDLDLLENIERHKFVSVLRGKKKKKTRLMDWRDINGDSINSSLTSLSSSSAMAPSMTDRMEFSKWVRKTVQEQLEKCRKLLEIESDSEDDDITCATSVAMSKTESELSESWQTVQEEWKQIIDVLWSDPMPQEGCIVNTVRGGGCYFGPDVTEKLLQKYNLQFLIRSHECKPEGYEFCHSRKVLTIFSASNYYEIGSNRGAYVKLGPDLVPHFVQYQASKTAHTLSMRQRISRVEESAFRALREKLFAHTSNLISAFKAYDKDDTGLITLSNWATAVESVLHLGLPWRMLRPQLVHNTTNGMMEYKSWLDDLAIEKRSQEHIQSSMLEIIYRNRSNLETIFRIIDSDHSGLISFEEFQQTWKLFSSHMNLELTDEGIHDLARTIDFNKDGNIDFNEFLEAFRLIERSHSEDKTEPKPTPKSSRR
ncbi:PREDICTED: serine/threonine-protein phosphatase with EF-hands 2 [Gavialis gangeticus]|uniref:serine/threonine-protein phosphatase with EF-hands 2 n=1 Tax=Gavialis gangeticus TaxID=94835 RepID=UPI00092E77D2|nr:PREDICTED: serine/threonine-protein phosphatase with EF-hands 2 [Gavialis gangeticus]